MVVRRPLAGNTGADRTAADPRFDPSVPAAVSTPPQLQQVVRPADHLPLRFAVRQTALLESVDSSARLGLTEHRFDDLAPLLVQLPTALREQLAIHPLTATQMSWD